MASTSLADIVRDETTRIGRALRLLDEHGEEIEHVAPYTYLVPSCSGGHPYRVTYGGEVDERCSCKDFEFHGEETPCKHLIAVAVLRARRRRRAKEAA